MHVLTEKPDDSLLLPTTLLLTRADTDPKNGRLITCTFMKRLTLRPDSMMIYTFRADNGEHLDAVRG